MNQTIQVFSCVFLLLMTVGSLLFPPHSTQGVIPVQQVTTDFSFEDFQPSPSNPEIEVTKAPPLDFFYGEEAVNLYETSSSSSSNRRGTSGTSSSDTLVINVDTDRSTYSPSQTINGIVQVTDNFVPKAGISVNLTIFAGEYWWYYCPFSYYLPYEEPPLVYSTILTTDADGEAAFNFDPENEGFFTIYAQLPSYDYYDYWRSTAIKTIQVASIATVWRVPYTWSVGDSILSYAAVFNTVDFTPVDGAIANMSLSVGWDEDQTVTNLYYGESNADGLAIAEFIVPEVQQTSYWGPYAYGYVILEITYGDSTITTYQWLSIQTSNSNSEDYYYWYDPYNWDGLYDFLITTDKPIYQPNQDVLVRLLLWESSFLNATRKAAANIPVEIELTDPQGFKIFHELMNTDQIGILSFSIPLDEDAELGSYALSFTVNGVTEVRNIIVDKYQRPAFRVDINAPDYVAPGKKLKGDFVATYYFGKPVAEGTFEAKIYIDKTLKTSKTGVLDADGKAELPELSIPSNDYYGYACEINVTVTDPAGRSVAASKVLSLRPELYIWGYAQNYRPAVGDPIDLTVYVYAFDSSYSWWWNVDPITATVTAKVYSTKGDWTPDKLIETATFDVEDGVGSYSIPIGSTVAAWYKEFLVSLTAETTDGRTGESYGYIWVKYNAIDLSLEIDDVIDPINGIDVALSLKNALTGDPEVGLIRLTLYDSEYDYLGKSVITVEGTEIVSIPLTEYASTGYYWATAVLCDSDGDPDWEVGYEYVHFRVGSIGKLEIQAEDVYDVYETASIDFVLTGVTTSTPIYCEVAKRGILSIQALSGITSLTIPIGIELSPQFTIYAFAIDISGHLYFDQQTIEVSFEIDVQISSNKEVYKPGETAIFDIELTDHAGNPLSGSACLALIDSSVYGVKEDEEPEKEIFTEDDVWSLVVGRVTWFSLYSWYGPYLYDYRGSYFEYGVPSIYYEMAFAGEDVDAQGAGPPNTKQAQEQGVKIRENLPETALWLPDIQITGVSSLEVVLPDNIGEWTLRAVITCGGKGILVKYTIKTFLDFFLQSKNPLFVSQDDTFKVSAILFNYASDVEADLSLSMTNVQILNNPEQKIMSISNGLIMVSWTVYALIPGTAKITLIAQSTDGRSDGLVAYTEIKPNAVKFLTEQSGLIDTNPNVTEIPFNIYSDAQPVSAKLTVVPGLEGATLEGWERLIGYPYGCIEQTMSRLLPTVTVYQYLQETDQLTPEDEDLLRSMIITGISRVYSMVQSNGGWGWWWKDEANVFMTSYVLYGLGLCVSAGFKIDSTIIGNAISLLLQEQELDGSWSPSYYTWRISTNLSPYVLRALLTANSSLISHVKVIKALDYLEANWNGNKNAYYAGLILSVIGGTATRPDFQTTLLDWLIANHNTDSNGVHWGDSSSWYALGGPVETTSVAIQGILATSDLYLLKVMQAVEWLMSRQARWGWGNTADTAAAIMALVEVAEYVTTDVDATIEVLLDDSIVDSFHVTTHEAAKRINLPTDAGSHILSISQFGTGLVFYHFELEQYVRNDPSITFSTKHVVLESSPEHHRYEVSVNLYVDVISPSIPINIAITPYSYGTLQLISDPVVTIDLIEDAATATFIFESISEASVIGGFLITYGFASRNDLTNQAPGTVSRVYGPVDLESTRRSSSALSSSAEIDQSLVIEETPDITVTRTYSRTTDIEIGEVITVTLKITNNRNLPFNYLIATDPVLPGYNVDTDSLIQKTASIAHAGLKGDHAAFFIPRLDKDTTVTIKYLITAITPGSVSALSATVSPMYQNEEYYSDPDRLETKEIAIPEFSLSGSISIDEISPTIFLDNVEPLSPTNADSITIKAIVQDFESGVQSVNLFYMDSKADIWATKNMLSNVSNPDQYIVTIQANAGTLRYFIQATDALGNVQTTEIYTLSIRSAPKTFPFLLILGLMLGTGAIAGLGTLGVVLIRKKYS
ncbi:MAG: MG2 domain-containing protein [Candidatus Hodarchaeota archaeon]